nr:iron uptake transporter deferrochelatase/peroxidase subunit [Nakamurella aerolata]
MLSGAALGAAGLLIGGGSGYAVGRSKPAEVGAATNPVPAGSSGSAPAASEASSGAVSSARPGSGGGADAVNTAGADDAVVPFYGERQAGVTTRQQEQMMFAAFDLTTMDPLAVQQLLGRWAAAAARFTQGKPVSGGSTPANRPPTDTGEGIDLGAHSLTITVGFGASMFDERFGLRDKMPAALRPFGKLPGEGDMRPELTGGDLCVQACADDPQVVFHAVRNLTRIARGTAVLRWSQLGFGRASATGTGQTTPRNLFGFKDGTRNLHADQTADIDRYVWVDDAATDQPWMVGGTYLVARKIAMVIESWDADFLADQERIFGRRKDSGAPLSGGQEFTVPDFHKTGANGKPLIDVRSHMALAAPENNNGVKILRRGYNYTDGQDPVSGRLAAGLFFVSFQRDPAQFKALQTKLGAGDLMNEYVTHLGGGTFACPPGVHSAGDWFGKRLFAG